MDYLEAIVNMNKISKALRKNSKATRDEARAQKKIKEIKIKNAPGAQLDRAAAF